MEIIASEESNSLAQLGMRVGGNRDIGTIVDHFEHFTEVMSQALPHVNTAGQRDRLVMQIDRMNYVFDSRPANFAMSVLLGPLAPQLRWGQSEAVLSRIRAQLVAMSF